MDRRDFLEKSAKVIIMGVPFVNSCLYDNENFIVSGEIGDLEKRLIRESFEIINRKYDLGDFHAHFIDGMRLKGPDACAFYKLGEYFNEPEFSNEMFLQNRNFINIFGHDLFKKLRGKNVIAIKPFSVLQGYYDKGIQRAMSRFTEDISISERYIEGIIHEVGHLIIFTGSGETKGVMEKIRNTNLVLAEGNIEEAKNHAGHVSYGSRFYSYENNNSVWNAGEQFAETFAFDVMDLPYDKDDKMVKEKFRIVRSFLEKHYGK